MRTDAVNVPFSLPQCRGVQRPIARAHFEKQQHVLPDAKRGLAGHPQAATSRLTAKLLDGDRALADHTLQHTLHVNGDVRIDRLHRGIETGSDLQDAAGHDEIGEADQLRIRPLRFDTAASRCSGDQCRDDDGQSRARACKTCHHV